MLHVLPSSTPVVHSAHMTRFIPSPCVFLCLHILTTLKYPFLSSPSLSPCLNPFMLLRKYFSLLLLLSFLPLPPPPCSRESWCGCSRPPSVSWLRWGPASHQCITPTEHLSIASEHIFLPQWEVFGDYFLWAFRELWVRVISEQKFAWISKGSLVTRDFPVLPTYVNILGPKHFP